MENYCSNCCTGTKLFAGAILGAYFFLPFDLFLCFSPLLVHSSAIVANYNYPIQVNCFFSTVNSQNFYHSFSFFVSTGILFVLLVFSYIWGHSSSFILKNPKTQGIILAILKSSNLWNVMYCPGILAAVFLQLWAGMEGQ